MRYAVVSDIHANLQAWNAVLLDLRTLEVDKVICLGDVIGYGPNPREVLESAYAHVNYFVLGNHDAVLSGKIDDSLFNDTARTILEWTRKQLGRSAERFLGRLPLSLEGAGFRCAHGDFARPGHFDYVFEPEEALPSWGAVDEQLLFTGHTHVPSIFVIGDSGVPHRVEPQDFVMEQNKRYLVNVGSVGQPRDGNINASYCIFDTDSLGVFWRKVPFDVDSYRVAVETAGIPVLGSYFLEHDPRGILPVRKMLNFSPATDETATRDVIEVQNLDELRRRVRRWKALAAAVAVAGLAALSMGGWAWYRYASRSMELVHPSSVQPVVAADSAVDVNLLRFPEGPVSGGRPIPGWSLLLGDGRRQAVEVRMAEDNVPVFTLLSGTAKDEIVLSSVPVSVEPGAKLRMAAFFKKGEVFTGEINMVMELTKQTDSGEEVLDRHIRKTPNEPRKGGWMLARHTPQPSLPAGTTSVRLQVVGKFVGEIQIRDMVLERR